ncbi:MAG: ABC transporter ATP-binding protein [Actinomycetota bacterium]|nr:ABC transporter ATP-binding protein [Actinomycetota bacterium]
MSKITLENITKYYGENLILDNISLEISDGEFFCITGPSGCGKTTLLRIIAGLDNSHSGKVYFDDIDYTDLSPSERNISMVFQDFALYPCMIARDNISFPLRLKKYPNEIISRKLKSTVDMIDLEVENYLDMFPKELSAGHRQRVATGRAIIKDKPRAILMDEPLSNLDARIRMNTKTYLKKLVITLDTTTIYVTSDSSEAMALADRIAVLNNQKFEQVGTPFNIYYLPKNMFIADFFGTMGINFIKGTVKDNKFYFSNYRVDINDYADKAIMDKIPIEPEIILGIRPEDISFSTNPSDYSIKAKVDLIQMFPPKANIRCRIENFFINVICTSRDSEEIQKNRDIYLDFNKNKIFLFYPQNGELITPARAAIFAI